MNNPQQAAGAKAVYTGDPTSSLIKGKELVLLIPAKLPMSYEDIARLARSILLSAK